MSARINDAPGRYARARASCAASSMSCVTSATVRGRSASAQACLLEALAIFAKLPSGYQRDLQLLKFPLFRGIDLALASAGIMAQAIDALCFRADRIRLDPSIQAAAEANELVVREGIPFREAYRRIGERYAARKKGTK